MTGGVFYYYCEEIENKNTFRTFGGDMISRMGELISRKVHNKVYFLFFSIFFSVGISAQTFTMKFDLGKDLTSSRLNFNIPVELKQKMIDTVHFGVEKVCIESNLLFNADMQIVVYAPDCTMATLFYQHIPSDYEPEDPYTSLCFGENNKPDFSVIDTDTLPIYKPLEALAVFNNGQNPNGNWRLHVYTHNMSGNLGLYIQWSITFGKKPVKNLNLYSTKLPIICLNTRGKAILNEPKVECEIGIIDHGPGKMNSVTDTFTTYQRFSGIEQRGSSSKTFAEKSYGINILDKKGDNKSISLLGLPADHDWILYPPFRDKAMVRNVLTYELAREMGQYASRTRYCEVMLNGQYQGVYILIEKIKHGPNRVNISKISTRDTVGIGLTGGYIFKIDKTNGKDRDGWNSRYKPLVNLYGQSIYFVYDYPTSKNLKEQQAEYMQNLVDSFETALTKHYYPSQKKKYPEYIDINSFVIHFFIEELSKNFDGYRSSCYFYKDRDDIDPKIHIGPVWDYDFAWHNSKICDSNNPAGWQYNYGDQCEDDALQIPFWWSCMMDDTTFTNPLRQKWDEFRKTVLSEERIDFLIDSFLTDIGMDARIRNYKLWPVKYYTLQYEVIRTMDGEIADLKQWVHDRLLWMDANIPKRKP